MHKQALVSKDRLDLIYLQLLILTFRGMYIYAKLAILMLRLCLLSSSLKGLFYIKQTNLS